MPVRSVQRAATFLLTGAVALAAAIASYFAEGGPGGRPVSIVATAEAHGYKLGAIAIGHVFARPPEKGAQGLAVYGPILNRGTKAARLVGVASPVAAEARLRIVEDGEVRWPDAVDLEPGRPLALAPWREHVWVSGLKRQLAEGQSFDLTLDFADLGRITVQVVVEKPGGH